MIRLQNLPLAILSLMISLGLWVYVRTQQAPAPTDLEPGTFQVEVLLPPLPPGFVRPTNLPKVYFRASGTTDEIARVTDLIAEDHTQLEATVDITSAKVGDNKLQIVPKYPKGFETLRWTFTPKEVRINLDQKTERQFDVQVEPFGAPPDGFLSEKWDTDPKFVTVQGLASKLEQIDHARVLLDLSKLASGSTEVPGTVELVNANNERLDLAATPPTVTILTELSPTSPVRKLLVFPSIVDQPTPGYRVIRVEVSPNQVVMRGPAEQLARTASVDTEPISIAGLTANHTFVVKVKPPAGLRQASAAPVRVTVMLAPVANPAPTPGATPTPSPSIPP